MEELERKIITNNKYRHSGITAKPLATHNVKTETIEHYNDIYNM